MLSTINTDNFLILFKESVNSTNDYLLDLLKNTADLQPKTVVIANQQTAGKGRQGRTWISPPGNIYLSLYWKFNCTLDKLYGLSLVVGIAIANVLKSNGLSDVKLKWPNDIFWQNNKLGGILIETKPGKNNTIDAVIGFGLNIKDVAGYKDQVSQNCVALESILQREIDKQELIAELLTELNIILIKFAQYGFDVFIDEWNKISKSKDRFDSSVVLQ